MQTRMTCQRDGPLSHLYSCQHCGNTQCLTVSTTKAPTSAVPLQLCPRNTPPTQVHPLPCQLNTPDTAAAATACSFSIGKLQFGQQRTSALSHSLQRGDPQRWPPPKFWGRTTRYTGGGTQQSAQSTTAKQAPEGGGGPRSGGRRKGACKMGGPISTRGAHTDLRCQRAQTRRLRSGCHRSRRRGCTALRTRPTSGGPACCQISETRRCSRPVKTRRSLVRPGLHLHCCASCRFPYCLNNMHPARWIIKI